MWNLCGLDVVEPVDNGKILVSRQALLAGSDFFNGLAVMGDTGYQRTGEIVSSDNLGFLGVREIRPRPVVLVLVIFDSEFTFT
jgi:hypothetical protein